MKRFVIFILLLGVYSITILAQNASKGIKAFESKDYPVAWENFEGIVKSDPNDITANFYLSKLFGIDDAENKSKEKALDHLKAAEAEWSKLDDKSKAKLEKSGITNAELASRRNRIESSFLEEAKELHSIEAYNNFLENFPDSKSATACRNYRNELAWEQTKENGSIEAMDKFIAKYPDADEIKVAKPIRDERATVLALQAGTEEALSNFLSKYPDAIQAPQIKQRLNAVAFENAKQINSIEAYKSYINRFPDSVFLTQAKERLSWLESATDK